MRFSALLGAMVAVVLASPCIGARPAGAQSVMKVCGDEWKATKAAGRTSAETWPQFLAQCRGQQKASSAAAPAPTTYAPAPVAPSTPAYDHTRSHGLKTVRECDDEYAANKPAIKASGQTKRDFVAGCRSGSESIPTAAAAPSAPVPAPSYNPPAPRPVPAPSYNAPAPAPAPANYGSASAPAQAPVKPQYSSLPASITAGEFASDQQAHARCPTDTVVWVNTRSRVYHFAGTHNYGHTKEGAYMCEADAKSAGDRAAMNESHP
jgi:hypothetical protein